MARRLKWTESAWADLEEIAEYIARDSRYYAAAFVRELRTAASSLADLAERGRVVPELESPSIREIFVQRYRIIYKVSSETVFILGVIHGARELLALWDKDRRER